MLKVGLTGGIGSGKSTVARRFGERGAHVIDADRIARNLVSPGSPALDRIVDEFGKGMLRSDGSLDRAALAAVVFDDPARRRILEGILHPPILAEIDRRIVELERTDPTGIVVVEAALIFEIGIEGDFDTLVVVWADEEQQIKRLMLRDDLPEEQARQRLAAQMPLAEKCRRADFVVDNSRDRDACHADVGRVYGELRRLARGGTRN